MMLDKMLGPKNQHLFKGNFYDYTDLPETAPAHVCRLDYQDGMFGKYQYVCECGKKWSHIYQPGTMSHLYPQNNTVGKSATDTIDDSEFITPFHMQGLTGSIQMSAATAAGSDFVSGQPYDKKPVDSLNGFGDPPKEEPDPEPDIKPVTGRRKINWKDDTDE